MADLFQGNGDYFDGKYFAYTFVDVSLYTYRTPSLVCSSPDKGIYLVLSATFQFGFTASQLKGDYSKGCLVGAHQLLTTFYEYIQNIGDVEALKELKDVPEMIKILEDKLGMKS